MDGFYRFDYAGRSDQGAGAIAFVNGKVAGLDVTGLEYLGTYTMSGLSAQGTVNVKNNTGMSVPLVQGVPLSPGQEFSVPFELSRSATAGHTISVKTPMGPVTLALRKIASF